MKQDKSFPLSILRRQIAVLFFFPCQLSPCKASYSSGESLRQQGLNYSLRLQVSPEGSQACPLQNRNAFALIAFAVDSVETVVVLEPSSGSHGKVSLFWRPSTLLINNCSVCIIHWLKRKQKWCLIPALFGHKAGKHNGMGWGSLGSHREKSQGWM